ncbi:hypothetical protein RvY_12832 [Ramazzottius varieornatus]|uniref:Uncharacterized protein n=1 Tax=Ramazzottius varieornatus TaxID=947166 RepID=A0A1D1VMU7_RAMVA|nr:hypothetical protein RvY_12832 [Ramazzottius varieornatus]
MTQLRKTSNKAKDELNEHPNSPYLAQNILFQIQTAESRWKGLGIHKTAAGVARSGRSWEEKQQTRSVVEPSSTDVHNRNTRLSHRPTPDYGKGNRAPTLEGGLEGGQEVPLE